MMNYDKLFTDALKGRSVNAAAKDWDMQQVTLNRYARGERVPDYQTTIMLASEARWSIEDAVRACALKEVELKPHGFFKKFLKIKGGAKSERSVLELYIMSNAICERLRRTIVFLCGTQPA